jgi:hypothetical protein
MSVFQKKIGRPEFLPVFLLVLCSMLARCYAREHRLGWSYARAGPYDLGSTTERHLDFHFVIF